MATLRKGHDGDDLRRHNLSVILDAVHQHGSASRADLTRTTGLNRSTIASLVEELSDRKLVFERPAVAASRMGRPSPLVVPRDDIVAIAINPEIGRLTVALVGLAGVVMAKATRGSDRPPTTHDVVKDSINIARALLSRSRVHKPLHVVGVVAAVPGMVRETDGVVRGAPQLQWVDEPIGAMLSESYGLHAQVANDANLGVSAEYRFGAGRGVEDLLYLHGGLGGIGAGILTRGVPLAGGAGYAGAVGHTLVSGAGRCCWCGATGCLETEVRQELFAKAMRDADKSETKEILPAEAERQLGHLATALKNTANILNPSLVILGGFLKDLDRLAPGKLHTLIRQQTFTAVSESMRIVPGQLGEDVLLIGAAERVFRQVIDDPKNLIENSVDSVMI